MIAYESTVQQTPERITTTKSAALVVQAPPATLRAVPPSEFDDQIEETMDYSPVTNVAVPDYPPEEWVEGSPGPLGF